MKVHVYGKPGTRKPLVADWIARRYNFDPASVATGEEPRVDVDLNVLCIAEFDRDPVPFSAVAPYAILIPSFLNYEGIVLEGENPHPDHVLGQQLDRLFRDRFGRAARATLPQKEEAR